MFVVLRMITLDSPRESGAPALASALQAAAAGLPGAGSCCVRPALAGVAFNGGHVVWRMEFATELAANAARRSAHWRAAVAPLLDDAEVQSVGYQATRKGPRPGGKGIWRALVFRVWPHGYPDAVRELEAALLMMPKYVPTIRGWGLNPVASVEGSKAYTHVWEQEFDAPEHFTGPYMDHPIHWGLVDSWFDAECPQYIVDPVLAQPVMAIDGPIIA